jgi:cysteinyl-tRNA synthetase
MIPQLKLYNTLTKGTEVFVPQNNLHVKVYVCGPTVYDYAHIGNARSAVVYDILYRILTYIFGKEQVIYVRNITDIDDKIINRAKELNCPISELTTKTTSYFHEHMRYLNCLSPTHEPKATEHLQEMIRIIEKLVADGFAYIAGSHVYFEVEKCSDYTKLSGRELEEMQSGSRIEVDKNKKHARDFVLWKPAEDLTNRSINFESPWGLGRPGWHIECSAMSHKYLGENFDIHGGGADLIFPHHTNEIAQSKCAFTGSNFANFWVHNGFLTVNGEKMSKSLGNFITVQDLMDRRLPGEVIRLFLISGGYRQPLDYNDKAINDAHKMLDYWYRALHNVTASESSGTGEINEEFMNSLLDDMNTPLAIKIINDYAKQIHAGGNSEKTIALARDMISCANFVGLLKTPINKWFSHHNLSDEVNEMLNSRKVAKSEKNWKKADEIRAQLLAKNIKIEDHPDGSSTAKFAGKGLKE